MALPREDCLDSFKAKLKEGGVVVGFQHNSGSHVVIEAAGYCGVDFVLIDMEHTAYTTSEVEGLVRTCELAGIVPFVRVPELDPHLISRVLDSGAMGILVPHIMNADDCARMLAAAQYQPVGTRGKSAMCRASRWGLQPWGAYAEWAKTGPVMVPIIEDASAVEHLDAILATPGLEVYAIGAGDLSQSFGEPTLGVRSPRVQEALRRSIELARQRGLHAMTLPAPDLSVELVNELVGIGVQVIWFGSDISFLSSALRSAITQVERTIPS